MLSGVALAAVLAAAPAGAEEPFVLDAAALDSVTAGGAKKAKAAGITVQAVLPSTGTGPAAGGTGGLAGLALKLAGGRFVVVPPGQTGGGGSTGNGKKTVTGSGTKSFKADRVTKRHLETLTVSGSASG